MTSRRKPEDAPDHVDGILAQWARERPDLDTSPMGILGRLGRLNRHTGRAIEAALGATGLQPWEFDVLATLRRAGPPYALSPGALIGSLMITSGTMTNRLDHLERAGLVRREPNPDDRRGLLVALTDAGRARVDHALALHVANEHSLLEGLTATERAQLAALLRRWLRMFEPPPGDGGEGKPGD
ncbi:MarR family winged helix-turn-helix transcriptional regulator [Cupriavidus taiwanensis]|uniref:MarR family winged helix-turn-helix transcriptional regulator n=1 Tax=Cupriavidus taiwanensis TaxID=164546 RepID=UPI000E1ACD13|nr:MarR family transcriptional regulator [Cupriavidus taiwanensis]SOY43699.1 putative TRANSCRIPTIONal REGULATOR, MarR family [Cupriavidus taiwanensis]